MTACVNKKSKRVAAVVTASLVGALSIGAPAVAFATDTNSGIELLAADANRDFSNGKATLATGGTLSEGKITAVANGNVIDIKVSKVTTATGNAETIDTKYSQSIVKADSEGKPTGEYVSKIVDPGKYCIEIKALAGDYKGAVIYVPVSVTAKEFGTIGVYEVNPSNNADLNDTTFYFTGSSLKLGITNDDVEMTEGVDYKVKFLKSGSSIDAAGVEVKDADTYYAVVTGLGKYAGQEAKLKDFVVNRFDLETSEVEVDPVIASNALPSASRVYRTDGKYVTELDPSLVKLTLASGIFSEAKEYNFIASPKTDKDPNFAVDDKGDSKTKKVSVHKYKEEGSVLYGDEALPSTFSTNLADKNPVKFDRSKVSAVYGKDKDKTFIDNIEITVTDSEGTVVSADGNGTWNETPGVYTVKVVATASDHSAAAVDTCTVTVKAKSVDADANVYVKYGDKVVTDVTVDFGTAVSPSNFTVHGVDGEDYEGLTDSLTMKLYNAKGEEVTSATDAGVYTLKVTSSKYELTGTTEVKVTVNKLDLSNVKIDGDAVDTKFGFTYVKVGNVALKGLNLKYLQGVDANSNGKLDDWKQFNQIDKTFEEIDGVKSVWQKLDEKTGQWADVNQVSANETGKFRCVVSPMNDSVTKNVSFATAEGTVFEFYVLDEDLKYADVLPTDWWFNSVNDADGLMNGYEGTSIFGAQDKLTRGQVAVILYNMAGGKNSELLPEGSYNEIFGWTSFDDVNGKEYYGKAIAWAKKAGVVNGYADGTFRPDNDISREEFACMLANFAKKFNAFQGVDVDEVLDDYTDGASVSDWAKESVAWAAKNKIMGKTGSITPASMITRAEAAAMAVDSNLRLDK